MFKSLHTLCTYSKKLQCLLESARLGLNCRNSFHTNLKTLDKNVLKFFIYYNGRNLSQSRNISYVSPISCKQYPNNQNFLSFDRGLKNNDMKMNKNTKRLLSLTNLTYTVVRHFALSLRNIQKSVDVDQRQDLFEKSKRKILEGSDDDSDSDSSSSSDSYLVSTEEIESSGSEVQEYDSEYHLSSPHESGEWISYFGFSLIKQT